MLATAQSYTRPTRALVRRRDRGLAIVVVALMLALAMVMVCAMTIETSRKLSMVRLSESRIRARLMARSGIEQAMAEFQTNPTMYNGTPMTEVQTRSVYAVAPPVRGNNRIEVVSTGVADGVAGWGGDASERPAGRDLLLRRSAWWSWVEHVET